MNYPDRNTIDVRTEDSVAGSFATRVYGWMTMGLLVTAVVAFFLIRTGAFVALMPYWWLPSIGTLCLAMAMGGMIHRISFKALAGMFLGYSALQGVFFGTVLPMFAASVGGEVIWMAFVTAGLVFGIAMLYGIFSKTDLTRFSRIFQIALWSLLGITAMYFICSFFMDVSGWTLLISYLGLIIFVALSAFDAQQIRRMSMQISGDSTLARKASLMMALKMYLNVIMIFWYLLQIFSSSRR